MKVPFGAGRRRDTQTAQTLVFFLLAWGTIMLLCGLAIDSGLLYLAKARLGRAVDGAALAAVGNFNRSSNAITNRDEVATIMRNFAVANYTDLSPIAAVVNTSGGTPVSTTGSNGQTQTSYVYNFNDGTQDANGQYRRFVEVTLNTGAGGNITSATCNARCPVHTYFIGYGYYFAGNGQNKQYAKIGGYSGPSNLVDLKVSSSAVATRNPRLIMVVVDRSASMLALDLTANPPVIGGANGLPPAVVQFLDFFDTSSDYIGIVSFGSSARLEMPLTTNFLIAGTNVLIDAYNTNTDPTLGDIPGVDPEEIANSGVYDPNYASTGIRRMKFGGQTAADEGIRMAMEQLMANPGFNDPDVIKYMVIFTDGAWNASRTLWAAPAYTNFMVAGPAASSTVKYLTNAVANSMTNGQSTGGIDDTNNGPWSVNLGNDTNLAVLPSMDYNTGTCIVNNLTNAIGLPNTGGGDFSPFQSFLSNQVFQSIDSGTNEPLYNPGGVGVKQGAPLAWTNTPKLFTVGTTNYYTQNVDIWLQPGAVAYLYTNSTVLSTAVSEINRPSKHVAFKLPAGSNERIELRVPGYVVDGIGYDKLDLAYSFPEDPQFPRYRCNNYQEAFMWQDDGNPFSEVPYTSGSLQRQLMFRNYPNLLTGFYVFRPDDPLSSATEPLDDTTPATYRPLYGLGPYYPSAGYYWPFDLVGVDYAPTYGLINPTSDPDPDNDQSYSGGGRHIAYSINMSTTNAAPEWAGELFYDSISGGGTNTASGTGSTSASQIMTSASWKTGIPSWTSAYTGTSTGIMTNEPTHNSNIAGSPSVFRPYTFTGGTANLLGSFSAVSPTDAANLTGGYIADGTQGAAGTHYYRNAMAWSGRPTHYFDVTQSKWVPVGNNHVLNSQLLPIGNWKAAEYAWHARALGVTIYTVGYGTLVTDDEQVLLAQIANATNTTAGGGSNISYNPSQPIGQQFFATNSAQISNDFYSVGQAINEALTGGQ